MHTTTTQTRTGGEQDIALQLRYAAPTTFTEWPFYPNGICEYGPAVTTEVSAAYRKMRLLIQRYVWESLVQVPMAVEWLGACVRPHPRYHRLSPSWFKTSYKTAPTGVRLVALGLIPIPAVASIYALCRAYLFSKRK